MDCEICGKHAGKGKQVLLDGSKLLVCDECASFGKEIAEERPAAAPARQLQGAVFAKIPPSFGKEKELDLGLEIAPDFGKIVRKAREAKGLTVKELAVKIFERESLLHRIENQGIKPSDAIISKLEKQLGVQLRIKPEKQ